MKSLIDFYDDSAQMWADNWYENESMLPYLKQFLQFLPNSPKVLDLCCGAGYESKRLKQLGANVIGIDLSEKSIEIAKKENPTTKFYVKDMLKSYSKLGPFDGIACISGLIHIEEKLLPKAFKNMHDALVEGGYIFISVKDGNEIRETSTYNGEVYARRFFCYTLDKLKHYSNDYFEFVKELESPDLWKHYIFKKK